MTAVDSPLYSPQVEEALRLAARTHAGHHRKGTDVPYLTHLFAVALILVKAGFTDDAVLTAALLHDAVEDTTCTLHDLADRFPPDVVEIVAALSEQKTDTAGNQRPWAIRKRDHLEHIRRASNDAKAVALADKLHNLTCMMLDYETFGEELWDRFNASPDDLLWYQAEMIEAATGDDERLAGLQQNCRDRLHTLQQRVRSAG